MTGTPNPLLGQRVVWVVCDGPDDNTQCTNYIPADSIDPTVASWGTAVAVFGEVDAYRLYGRRITALLMNRTLNPLYDPLDPDAFPQYIETVIDTYTQALIVDTDQRDQIHPAIEIYDGQSGLQSVCGIIDGTYYIYPVVFQDAQFCYVPRCSSQYPSGSDIEICISGNGTFPLEPHKPDCTPVPVYPMDAITKWTPSSQPSVTIRYTATWEYYLGNAPSGSLQTSSIDLDMVVYPPPNDWAGMKAYMEQYTYFANGIYH